jgi:transposase
MVDIPKGWTVNSLRFYLEDQTGILLSYERLRVLLHEMGYEHTATSHRARNRPRIPVTVEQIRVILKTLASSPPRQSSTWVKRPAA